MVQLEGPPYWAVHCLQVLFLCTALAFPVGGAIAKNRVEIEQRGQTGLFCANTNLLYGRNAQAGVPTTAVNRDGLLSSQDLLLNFCISRYWGQAWFHQWVADSGMMLLMRM